jgi:hypothetical protein
LHHPDGAAMKLSYVLEVSGPTVGNYDRISFDSFESMNDAFRNRAHDGLNYTFEIIEDDFYWRLPAASSVYRPVAETPV